MGVVLVVAGPGHGEGLRPVQQLAPGGRDVQARIGVLGRIGEVEVDPAQGVDGVLEAGEVDLDHVVDLNAEVGRDRLDELVGARVEGRVDAVVGAVL